MHKKTGSASLFNQDRIFSIDKRRAEPAAASLSTANTRVHNTLGIQVCGAASGTLARQWAIVESVEIIRQDTIQRPDPTIIQIFINNSNTASFYYNSRSHFERTRFQNLSKIKLWHVRQCFFAFFFFSFLFRNSRNVRMIIIVFEISIGFRDCSI